MKKILLISNVVTLGLLIFLGLHYRVPQKIFTKFFKVSDVQIDSAQLKCSYPLSYFDFHYKKECDSSKVIMLGNSIIRHGKWVDLLGRKDVINRGISGDNLPCICERLKYLKGINARIWFLEGGINDLPESTPESVFENYKTIIEFVKSENAIPVINLLLYISPKAGSVYPSRADFNKINDIIAKLNKLLVTYAESNNIDYIDLNKVVSSENVLKDEFTTDGVHITDNAYNEWAILINRVLKKYNI